MQWRRELSIAFAEDPTVRGRDCSLVSGRTELSCNGAVRQVDLVGRKLALSGCTCPLGGCDV
jgi:hypothetical protein